MPSDSELAVRKFSDSNPRSLNTYLSDALLTRADYTCFLLAAGSTSATVFPGEEHCQASLRVKGEDIDTAHIKGCLGW